MNANVPPDYLRRRARAVHDLLPRERWGAVVLARPRSDRLLINAVSWEAGVVLHLMNPHIGLLALADLLREVRAMPTLMARYGSAERFVELALSDRYGGLWLLVEAEASLLAVDEFAGAAA